MIDKLIEHFSELKDPRCPGKVEHRLIDILVIGLCAVIACAESWEDIALYGRSKLPWLRQFLALSNGIPSHDMFRRVFMLIGPETFEACFTAWVSALTTAGAQEVVLSTARQCAAPSTGVANSPRCTWSAPGPVNKG